VTQGLLSVHFRSTVPQRPCVTLSSLENGKRWSFSLMFYVLLSLPKSPTRCATRGIANSWLIRLRVLLHACSDRYEQRTQASYQVPKSAVMRQTCQHPLLFRLALQVLMTLKHQVFMQRAGWTHRLSSCSCTFPEASLLFTVFNMAQAALLRGEVPRLSTT
jgi:hypothetical protein